MTTIPQKELMLDFELNLVPGSTKAAMSDSGSSSRDLWQVKIEDIRLIPNFNARVKNEKYAARVEEIANSMLLEGYKQNHPLAGYVAKEGNTNVIYLYAGHTRFDAVKLAVSRGANIVKVPMVIAPIGTSVEDLTVDLVTGNNGERLTAFEVGIVCKRLIGYNWSPTEIAMKLNMKEPAVNDLLLLMSAPKFIRDLVQSDTVSASEAIKMLHKYGSKAVEVMQKSLERAQAAGKSKITAKHVPGAIYKKAVLKSAPVMVTALKAVQSDPGFASLSPENQAKLADLLTSLAVAETEDSKQGTSETKTEAKSV